MPSPYENARTFAGQPDRPRPTPARNERILHKYTNIQGNSITGDWAPRGELTNHPADEHGGYKGLITEYYGDGVNHRSGLRSVTDSVNSAIDYGRQIVGNMNVENDPSKWSTSRELTHFVTHGEAPGTNSRIDLASGTIHHSYHPDTGHMYTVNHTEIRPRS